MSRSDISDAIDDCAYEIKRLSRLIDALSADVRSAQDGLAYAYGELGQAHQEMERLLKL